MAPLQGALLGATSWLHRIPVMLLCLLLVTPVLAQNQSQEVQVLLDFKDKTFGYAGVGETTLDITFNAYYNTWNSSDKTPCSWVGVSCTSNSTVEQLDLSGWELPELLTISALAQLPDLRQLDLSSNSFVNNNIPSDIGNLTALTRLDLSNSGFLGRIPSSLSKCNGLRYLNLGGNLLSGEIPSLLGLVNLQLLLLADNQLTGPLPEDLGDMRSLVGIDVSGNRLSGPIPSFSNLASLSDLHLENNNFSKFEDSLSLAAESLLLLSVSDNDLEGTIPQGLLSLQKLQSLDMSGNKLSGSIPYGFSRLWNGSLLIVDVSRNQLTGEIPSDFLLGTGTWGISINLSRNLLSGNVLLNNSNFGLNCSVDLSYNQLNGSIASMIYNDEDAGIDSLWLQNNLFSEDLVDVLLEPTSEYAMISTVELRLGNNLFTGDLSRMVDQWSTTRLFTVQVLDLSDNNLRMSVTDAIPDPLGATLQTFASGAWGPTELWMRGNNFSGTPLPTTYYVNDTSTLGVIRILDLSNTHLTGEISGDVFNSTWFPGLQSLNLSGNDISGFVPGNLLLLPNLTVLDVSNNNLSGALPVIPLDSRFYDPRIFAGNDDLCGDPLSRCLPPPITGGSTGVTWWMLLIIIGAAVALVLGSGLVAVWRWRVYQKLHQQDADLIKTLMDRDSATLMSLRDIKKATGNFSETEQIGEGGFGTVYKGKLSNGTTVAIKRTKREGSEKEKQQFLNEVRILSQVNHRNLVKLLGCCLENKVAVLVFEFISNGTLQEHLQGKLGEVCLTWKQRLKIAVQTADALNYLHAAATFPIYHRDVKSANILLDEDLDAKVADFGISRLAPRQATHVTTAAIHGTMGYIDPEYYTSLQLTDRSDVYSFGVVLLELISAKPVIDVLRGADKISLVSFAGPHIARGELRGFMDPALEKAFSDPAGEERESILNVARLALQCLEIRSKARPSMNEVLKELESLWLQLCGVCKPLNPVIEDRHEEPLLVDFFRHNSSSIVMPSDASVVEMAELFSTPVEGDSELRAPPVRSVSLSGRQR